MDLRIATTHDVEKIAKVARISWTHHYPDIITQEQIDYMLERMYSLDSLKDQIGEKGHKFILAFDDSELKGFVSISPYVDDVQCLFIHKFYILPDAQRSGIGTALYSEVIKYASEKGHNSIRLQVNRKNFKAVNFYFKVGFIIEKVEDFDIGNGYEMNDFIMRCEFKVQSLKACPTTGGSKV